MGSWIYQSRLCREERAVRRAGARRAEWERQMKALELLIKMGSDPQKMWAPRPWSFQKPRGFRVRISDNVPHQGEREKTRRMRQMGASWA